MGTLTGRSIAAFVLSVIAVIVSSVSAFFAGRSLRFEAQSAEAAIRSADAAEAANRLVESHGESDGRLVEAAGVSFRLERTRSNTWVLRNIGTDVADHVRVEKPNCTTRRFPTNATIAPGEGIDLLMIGAMGAPVPNQLYVSWDGQPDPVAVPVGP